MYEFLSDDWIEAARQLEAGLGDNPVSVEGLVVNATVTGAPFGESGKRTSRRS